MDQRHLNRVFVATAFVSAVVALIGVAVDSLWGGRYAVVATLALANWFALSRALLGVVNNRLLDIAIGIALKPFLLLLLLVFAKQGGIEISSFLAGINTFFVTLFGYMAWRAFAPNARFTTVGS